MRLYTAPIVAILTAQIATALIPTILDPLGIFHHTPVDPLSTLPPSLDRFYEVPANISIYPKGSIIRSRLVPNATKIWGPNSGDVYQIFYRTNGVRMTPDATVATVIAPRKPAPGPVRIVAVAAPEDSPAVDCALSWAAYPHTKSEEAWGGISGITTTSKAALYNGWYVSLPDAEGSKAGFLAYSEGQALLDSIRALANFTTMIPDSTGYKAALTGYSGGGHGCGWAAQLASTYGKGIPIAGVATGGIAVDIEADLLYLDGKVASGMCYAGLVGIANAYPELNTFFNSIMTPFGKKTFANLRDGSLCLQKSLLRYAFHHIKDIFSTSNYLNNTLSQQIIAENYLGRSQPPILDFPFYQIHTQEDDIVPYGPAIQWYQQQCDKGGNFLLTNPLKGKHVVTGQKSVPSFFFFLKQAFAGTFQLKGCHNMTNFLVDDPTGPLAVETVGQEVVDTIKKATSPFGLNITFPHFL